MDIIESNPVYKIKALRYYNSMFPSTTHGNRRRIIDVVHALVNIVPVNRDRWLLRAPHIRQRQIPLSPRRDRKLQCVPIRALIPGRLELSERRREPTLDGLKIAELRRNFPRQAARRRDGETQKIGCQGIRWTGGPPMCMRDIRWIVAVPTIGSISE